MKVREDGGAEAYIAILQGLIAGGCRELWKHADSLRLVHPHEAAGCGHGSAIAHQGALELRLLPVRDVGVEGPAGGCHVVIRDSGRHGLRMALGCLHRKGNLQIELESVPYGST